MSAWRRLYRHFEDYHAWGPPRLKYAGWVGAAGFLGFYFVRFTRPNAALLDDALVRGLGVLMFALMGLKEHWPQRLRPCYLGFCYLAMVYTMPFFATYTGLTRGGGVPAISNGFILLSFLVLLSDWRNTLLMLALGIGAAAALYLATAPAPRLPLDMVAQVPAYVLVVVGGSLFKLSTEQIDAERRLRATQALAGSLAHELRHPLARVRQSLRAIGESLPPPGAAAGATLLSATDVDALYRHLGQGDLAIERGLQVISMTLDEVSARPVDTSAFSCLSAAEATEKAVREYAYDGDTARERVRLEVEHDFTFRGDETAYLFVLFNLLKNALHYLPTHPETVVRIRVTAQEVRVRDTGPGIAPQLLQTLFEPFQSAGKAGGTGLGLAYCERVMRAFGGSIRCESRLGAFTEFILAFPPLDAEEAQRHQDAVLAEARAVLAGRRVLLVEDDAAQRQATRQKLAPTGVHLEEAEDGVEALARLERETFDLVLLDLNMPRMDGYTVARRVRDRAGPQPVLVAHSSEPAHLALPKAHKVGMDAFVAKPSAQLPLMRAVQHALQQHGARRGAGQLPLAGRRILLADDGDYSRKASGAWLLAAGAQVVEAAHGQQVLQRLADADAPFHAVLMDIEMPGMGGVEATAAIRRSGASWSGVPVIALTAHSDRPTLDAARAAGMDAFLVKPVDPAVLQRTLADIAQAPRPVAPPPMPRLAPLLEQAAGPGALLDLKRLDSYRRLGLLDELLQEQWPQVGRLLERLRALEPTGDGRARLDLMHSLLGTCGEAGASALHQRVRAAYVPLIEEGRPPPAGWLDEMTMLAKLTGAALQDFAAAPRDPG